LDAKSQNDKKHVGGLIAMYSQRIHLHCKKQTGLYVKNEVLKKWQKNLFSPETFPDFQHV